MKAKPARLDADRKAVPKTSLLIRRRVRFGDCYSPDIPERTDEILYEEKEDGHEPGLSKRTIIRKGS